MDRHSLTPWLVRTFLIAGAVAVGAYGLRSLHPTVEMVMVGATLLAIWTGTALVIVCLEPLNKKDR